MQVHVHPGQMHGVLHPVDAARPRRGDRPDQHRTRPAPRQRPQRDFARFSFVFNGDTINTKRGVVTCARRACPYLEDGPRDGVAVSVALVPLIALAACGDDDDDGGGTAGSTNPAADTTAAGGPDNDRCGGRRRPPPRRTRPPPRRTRPLRPTTTAGEAAAPSGDPIKVMTVAPVNTNLPPYPNIPAAAEIYVQYINDRGGIQGRPLR